MVESKFKFGTLLAIILSLVLLTILTYIFCKTGIAYLPFYAGISILILLISIFVWLIFGELRTKAVKVKIENETIVLKKYAGFGIENQYNFKEFDGYKISVLSSEYREYEYLYLLIDQKKVIKVSQFYHSNYSAIKHAIIKKTNNLGKEDFNILAGLKDIFSA